MPKKAKRTNKCKPYSTVLNIKIYIFAKTDNVMCFLIKRIPKTDLKKELQK